MGKIINKLKSSLLFTFIISGILFGSIGIYAASIYYAKDISYEPSDASWEVNNVNEAISSLHDMLKDLENIKSIGDATAANILSGKKAVVKGSTVTGTMTNRAVNGTILNDEGIYTIPAGYHNGNGKVTGTTQTSQIVIPSLTTQVYHSNDYDGYATLTLDVSNYSTLTIGNITLSSYASYCEILDQTGRLYYTSTTENITNRSDIELDLSSSTTLTIKLYGRTSWNHSMTVSNIVIK